MFNHIEIHIPKQRVRVEPSDGEVVLLGKSTIAQVRPFDAEQPGLRRTPIPLAHPCRSGERHWRI